MAKTSQPVRKPSPRSHAARSLRSRGAGEPSRDVGLRDVARVAGVSTATVSRAMNAPDLVSPELRARVSSVIRHLGWVPHGAARTLSTKRSGTIGAVLPTLAHGDFSLVIHVLQDELARLGYTLLLACSEYDQERELGQVRKMIERGVDGLVLVGQLHHAEVNALVRRRGVAVVHTFVHDAGKAAECIGPDNRKAFHRLTDYLIGLGHRRFGVIAQATDNNDRAQERLAGIRDALAEHALAIPPAHFRQAYWRIEEGREQFRHIVAQRPWPTALICGNAYLAIGAILESQAMGIAVPGTMSIVGHDDVELLAQLPIPLTTIRVSVEDIGRRAARALVARIEGRDEPVHCECEARIVVRASSGPPPGQLASEVAMPS